MNDSEFYGPIRNVLRNIIICAGEPLVPSESILELFYQHLISVTTSWIMKFQNTNLTFEGILRVIQNQPRKLNRVFNYFRVLAGTSEFSLAEGDDFSLDSSRALNRFYDLCNTLKIVLPQDQTATVVQSPFMKGQKLRLHRIDRRISLMSVEEYLEFTKLRQSASFLSLIKLGAKQTFKLWIMHCENSLDDHTKERQSLFSACSEKDDRTGLCLLAHLITDDILDLIDVVLYLRRKFAIELSSPLTPIEIKQGIQQLRLLSSSF
ncbi:unnamed protein product [Echinostoma caproni]|uniref:Uncharacterized protein n=1 Tax=Echinostoma caproni TaxID=27848 RepID=A0A183AKS2_9TREM|nr:unnamed protein product [Echinostoma caproni]